MVSRRFHHMCVFLLLPGQNFFLHEQQKLAQTSLVNGNLTANTPQRKTEHSCNQKSHPLLKDSANKFFQFCISSFRGKLEIKMDNMSNAGIFPPPIALCVVPKS